jgi:hypothetical protein
MTELQPHFWCTENFASRFFRCQMSLENPFSSNYISSEACWIYVTRDSLYKFLGKTPAIDEVGQPNGSETTGRTTQDTHMPAAKGSPASKAQIRRAAKELYQQPGKPPNLNEAEKQLRDMLDTPRRLILPILQEHEFASLRLKRGKRYNG